MEPFATEIAVFIEQNSTDSILYNFDAFPLSPFTYIYLADRQTIIHCVALSPQITDIDFLTGISSGFAQQGLKVIHLWEDQWHTRKAIVQSRLLSMLGKSATIPARLSQCRRIDKPTLDAFLEDNHMQMQTGAKFKYGLFLPHRYFRVIGPLKNTFATGIAETLMYKEELLIAVASFSTARRFVREGATYRSYELIRFANLKGFTVVGGFDKLLQAFIKEQNPDDIMTYADADWSDGTSYKKLGFERQELTPPLAFRLDEDMNRIMKPGNDDSHRPQVWNTGSWKYLLKLKKN